MRLNRNNCQLNTTMMIYSHTKFRLNYNLLTTYIHFMCSISLPLSLSPHKHRQEVKMLNRANKPSSTKEHLTVDWLSQSITELRSEVSELQEASSNTSRHLQQRNIVLEDIAELRTDYAKLQLELIGLRERQDETDKIVHELRNEAIQSADDLRKNRLHVSEIQFYFTITMKLASGL